MKNGEFADVTVNSGWTRSFCTSFTMHESWSVTPNQSWLAEWRRVVNNTRRTAEIGSWTLELIANIQANRCHSVSFKPLIFLSPTITASGGLKKETETCMFVLSKLYSHDDFLYDWESGQCPSKLRRVFLRRGTKGREGELAIPLLSRIPWIRAGEVTSRDGNALRVCFTSHQPRGQLLAFDLCSLSVWLGFSSHVGGAVGTYNCGLCGELWMRQMQLLIRRNIRLTGNTQSFVQLFFDVEHW